MNEIDNLSFEEAFTELEELVQQLEAGDLTLDQAMALFERGMALATQCNVQLDASELRVQQLMSTSEEHPSGEDYELGPFEEYLPD
ncbi:MAG: exodeoxyribonuclease VII small subunit [Anaerolineales bacterium]|nr:MAG: exodeoxyribonuclease VII small subunit [Anaerolineales bacterium]